MKNKNKNSFLSTGIPLFILVFLLFPGFLLVVKIAIKLSPDTFGKSYIRDSISPGTFIAE